MPGALSTPAEPLPNGVDPTWRPVEVRDGGAPALAAPNRLERLLLRAIVDPRDLPILILRLQATFLVLPAAVALFLLPEVPLLAAVAYLGVVFLGFADRYTLALHNTSHRRLLVRGLGAFDVFTTFALGPLFGHSPGTYFAHHIGMHHAEENLKDDLSTTMPFRRDSLLHFASYFGRFFLFAALELPYYFYRKGRYRLMRQAFFGEVSWLAAVALLATLRPGATLVVLVIPVVVMRFLMMAGNWAQHAFIDPAAPEDAYRSSITCINTRYNRRCFNDGYHIGHHLEATRHWSEMPADFRDNLDEYSKRGAVVFDGVDYFQIWVLLMLRRIDWLAKYYVPLSGPMPREEIIRRLEARLG